MDYFYKGLAALFERCYELPSYGGVRSVAVLEAEPEPKTIRTCAKCDAYYMMECDCEYYPNSRGWEL